jgi:hypothetical protein
MIVRRGDRFGVLAGLAAVLAFAAAWAWLRWRS